jgi:hypothetical protein
MGEMNDHSTTACNDPLADRLRLCAASERPAFSAELHRDITVEIAREAISERLDPQIRRWIRAAAAVILAALIPLAWWTLRSGRNRPSPPTVVSVERSHSGGSAPTDVMALMSSTDNLISARLWPPALLVRLPIPAPIETPSPVAEDAPAATAPIELPGSPGWLLAALQQSEDRALSTFDQVLPPQLRDLVLWRRTNLH